MWLLKAKKTAYKRKDTKKELGRNFRFLPLFYYINKKNFSTSGDGCFFLWFTFLFNYVMNYSNVFVRNPFADSDPTVVGGHCRFLFIDILWTIAMYSSEKRRMVRKSVHFTNFHLDRLTKISFFCKLSLYTYRRK